MALPLVIATARGLSYQPQFAQARNLPGNALLADAIETVVTGWAVEDGCWHLGVLFTPSFAHERGGRWCGLARWSDTTAHEQALPAETAGRALADALRKPFQLITSQVQSIAPEPPHVEIAAAPDDGVVPSFDLPASSTEPVPLPMLPDVRLLPFPITVGTWALVLDPSGLRWSRSRAWRIETLTRCVVFGALAVLFAVLSIGELHSIFAPVQPDWLPFVGLGIAAVLALNALYCLGRLLTTSAVEFDQRTRMVRFVRRPTGVIKQVPFEKIQYLLLSHTLSRHEPIKGAVSDSPFERVSLEAWLHLARDKGDFVEIGHIAPAEGRAVHAALHLPRHPLALDQIDTPVHQATARISELLNVPAMVEDRS